MKLDQYSSAAYNQLPLLGDSYEVFQAQNLDQVVSQEIREIYLRHGVQNRLGLLLMHRHFALEQGELLVNVNNVAVPWNTNTARKDLLTSVQPTQWQFLNGALVPSEFTYLQDANEVCAFNLDADGEFVEDLHRFLESKKLEQYFGIGILTREEGEGIHGPAPVEMTHGRANIALPFGIEESVLRSPEVSWWFDPNPFVMRGCSRACYAQPPGHLTSHTTTKS